MLVFLLENLTMLVSPGPERMLEFNILTSLLQSISVMLLQCRYNQPNFSTCTVKQCFLQHSQVIFLAKSKKKKKKKKPLVIVQYCVTPKKIPAGQTKVAVVALDVELHLWPSSHFHWLTPHITMLILDKLISRSNAKLS